MILNYSRFIKNLESKFNVLSFYARRSAGSSVQLVRNLAKECCSCLYSDLTSSKQALHLVRGYLIASVDISLNMGKEMYG